MTKEDACERLENLNLRNSSTKEVRELLEVIGIIPIMTAKLNTGTRIHRTRMGRGYYQPWQLTYKKPRLCTSMQRASLPNESVFYGCLSDDQSRLEYGRMIGLLECSKLAKDMKGFGREYVTASVWEVTEPINIISFITDRTFAGEKKLCEIVKHFVRLYKEKHRNIDNIERRVGQIIDREFSKVVDDNRDYLITATLVHDMLFDFKEDIDAVLYPSVQTRGDLGLNIAIKPEVADRKLSLHHVIDQTHYRNKDNSFVWLDKGYDANHHLIPSAPLTNEILYEKTGIGNTHDFPIIRH